MELEADRFADNIPDQRTHVQLTLHLRQIHCTA